MVKDTFENKLFSMLPCKLLGSTVFPRIHYNRVYKLPDNIFLLPNRQFLTVVPQEPPLQCESLINSFKHTDTTLDSK